MVQVLNVMETCKTLVLPNVFLELIAASEKLEFSFVRFRWI